MSRVYAWVEKKVALPPLPWEEIDTEDYEQGQLF
jgi:hypothetical protein